MKLILKYSLIGLLLLPILTNTSCNSFKRGPSKAVQETEERQEEQAERQREEYLEAKERHLSIQTKSTKKEMKMLQRKSKRHNAHKKKFFLVRWWESIFKYNKWKKPKRGGN